jgi:hypothetical protein
MFKDQLRMHQHHGSQNESPLGEVATVEFQAGERAEPSLDLVEIPLIDTTPTILLVLYSRFGLNRCRPLPPTLRHFRTTAI